jgi:preprotein translocase subunit SecA
LNEFKVEAYRMFDELKATIRHDVTHTIFRVTVRREAPVQQPRRVTEGRVDLASGAVVAATGGAAATATAARDGATGARQSVRTGPKIGRNDPCWCGSGKKFKRCHGA